MDDPRSTSPGSIMPRYSWLLTQKMEMDTLPSRLNALRRIGVPYTAERIAGARVELEAQADKVVANLKLGSVKADADKEIIALIAYLQRLGTDIKSAPATTAAK